MRRSAARICAGVGATGKPGDRPGCDNGCAGARVGSVCCSQFVFQPARRNQSKYPQNRRPRDRIQDQRPRFRQMGLCRLTESAHKAVARAQSCLKGNLCDNAIDLSHRGHLANIKGCSGPALMRTASSDECGMYQHFRTGTRTAGAWLRGEIKLLRKIVNQQLPEEIAEDLRRFDRIPVES